MDFFQPKKKKPSELFARAGLLGIFFVIVLIFFITTSKNEKSLEASSQVLKGMTKYKSFDEKQKDDLKLRNAGFWQYASDTNSENSTFYMTDRVELKTNGIFWRVTEHFFRLPSKKSTRFMHIENGYMNPFAKNGSSLDSIVCDVRIIRQVFIRGNDTCFGPSNFDTTWNVVATGKRFNLDEREYRAYDTAGPALFRFFPEGALDIIDKVPSRSKGGDKAYMVGNKTVFLNKPKGRQDAAPEKPLSTFNFYQCSKLSSFDDFAREAIAEDMSKVLVDTLNIDAIQRIIDAYYRVFLEKTMKDALRKENKRQGQLKAAFDVTWEGKVVNISIGNLDVRNDKIKESILRDMGSWTFPRLRKSATSQHVEREFWF